MNTKKISRNVLLAIACGSVLYMGVKEITGARNDPSPQPTQAHDAPGARLIVYYLSEGKDCATCENIEAYTRETLDTHFADKLATGEIAFVTADMDAPQNKHFVTDYSLYTKSVVLSQIEDGDQVRWKNLEEIWGHVYDKEAFVAYVQKEIGAFLETQLHE